MSRYYLLECLVPAGATVLDIRSYPEVDGVESWLLGVPFANPPCEPIALEWDPDTSGIKKEYYDASIPLMHAGLLDALHGLGIDNLDTYPVAVRHPETGALDVEYRAVNVIGLVRAADLDQSVFRDESGRRLADMDFDCLAIDASRAGSLRFFRLAECVTALVVAASVKEGLERKGGFGLCFVEPAQWIG